MHHFALFDSHLHIIDPAYPIYANQGFTPAPFTTEDYLAATKPYNLKGGAVVSGSFQKQDQSYLLGALKKLGANFVGVTQLAPSTPDETILTLAQSRICGLRFNLKRGGSQDIKNLVDFGLRVYALANWHVELYVDAKELSALYPAILALPSVAIDHLGLSKAGFPTLLKLAERGVKVKASGFGRVDFDPAAAMAALYQVNPDCLMFGTDLPSTRAPRAFESDHIRLIFDHLGTAGAADVLFNNAFNFYRQQQR